MSKVTGYELSRNWFDFCFENPEKIKPSHTALYFYIIDRWNRFGNKTKFGLPTLHTMESIGIKSKDTYFKAFKDLVEYGFIKIVQKSINQNTANIISLSAIRKNRIADMSALDTANVRQTNSTHVSVGNIDKQRNKETKKQRNKYNNITDEIKNFTASLSKLFPEDITSKLKDNEKWNWVDTIDKLIRLDKFTNKEIEIAVKAGRNSEFWNKQFLSLTKLRKKNKDDIKYINVFLNLNGYVKQSVKLKEFK